MKKLISKSSCLLLLAFGLSACNDNSSNVEKNCDGAGAEITWRAAKTIISEAKVLGMDLTQDGHIYVGVNEQNGGVFRSTDGGANWEKVFSFPGVNFTELNLHITTKGDIYAANSFDANFLDGMFRSLDNGQTWTAADNGIAGQIVLSIISSPDGAAVFAGTGLSGLYKTTNQGGVWTPAGNGMSVASIPALLWAANGKFYAGTDRGIFISEDDGQNWISIPSPDFVVGALAVDGNGGIYAGTQVGLSYSPDNGATWNEINEGLRDEFINNILIDSRGDLIVGTLRAGVFKSINGGECWFENNEGMGLVFLTVMRIKSDDTIYTATFGQGVFISN